MMEESKELKSSGVKYRIDAGKKITKILVDNDKLNVIFVGTDDQEIYVIDPTLGDILYHTSFKSKNSTSDNETEVVDSNHRESSNKPDRNDWDFSIGPDKIIVVSNNKVGIRSEYKGIALLNTILQTPIKNSSEIVQIELNISEAESLCHSLAAVDASIEPDTLEVEKELKSIVKRESSDLGSFVKREKWTTVKLELSHSVLKSTFQSMVNELWKKNAYIPQLSTASSILERLNMLLPPEKVDLDRDAIDKTQMFSESARLETFQNWPHSEYKWASPSKMAQAGFYHHPSAHGEDRALCFTCHVCLVLWESGDEPWSEHERHSPFCPFVRGEHTHNVPLSISYATAPAFTIKQSKSIGFPILGSSSCPSLGIVGYSLGLVVVWDLAKEVKEAVEFEVNYKDVESLETSSSTYSDIHFKPKEAWVMDISDPSKSIIPPETNMNLAETLDKRIILSSVAVLGAPSASSKKSSTTIPPSVVVGATIHKYDRDESGSEVETAKIPVILVYGLSGTEINDESRDVSATDIFKAIGSADTNKGTQQEASLLNQSIDGDEELFISYMSESDMSLFSDITESSGTFILDQNPMSVSMSNTSGMGAGGGSVPIKKKSLPPKKAESTNLSIKSSKGSRGYLKSGPNVLIAQKIDLPFDLNHCCFVKYLLPTVDRSQLVVIVESSISSNSSHSSNNTKDNNGDDGVDITEEMNESLNVEDTLSIYGAILIYNVNVKQDNSTNTSSSISTTNPQGVVSLNYKNPMIRKIDDPNDLIVNVCLIPPNLDVSDEPLLACVLKRGDVAILNLNDLVVLHRISRPSPDTLITSVSYCASLERLCCGTSTGVIELYSINGHGDSSETDSFVEDKPGAISSDDGHLESMMDDKELIDLTSLKKKKHQSSSSKSGAITQLIANSPLTLSTLKQLLELTQFENLKPGFSANVPGCWQKIIQAQKDRKHPQHLQSAHESDFNSTTLSWRLQRNKNSKKEHLIELSLPQSVLVGHLDLKFVLQMGCISLPTIEVTLYKAAKLKSRGDNHESNGVDKSIDFNQLKLNRNLSNEYLKSLNAEVVCGPLDLSQHVDLSAQGGSIVFTSPTLMLSKARNFYLHIRAKSTKSSDNSSSSGGTSHLKTKSKDAGGSSSSKLSAFSKFTSKQGYKEFQYKEDPSIFYPGNPFLMQHPIHKMTDSPIMLPETSEKKKDFVACDWIHEISITVKVNKKSTIPHEEQERKVMLTSPTFISKLLSLAVFEVEDEKDKVLQSQSYALDILVWVAAINLCGPPISNPGSNNYQLTFIRIIQTKLKELILHGILFADRSTSHKTAKLLVICMDSVENYHSKEDREPFLSNLLQSLLELLPFTISSVSAGSMQWFFLLLNRVRTTTPDGLSLASESLLSLLNDVTNELHKRNDPYNALLRTRFGLYGTPFESELFEIEPPPVCKSSSSPLTYPGVCADSQNATSANGSNLWGLKDVDFRDLLLNGTPMRFGKVGNLAPKQQIQGLLEVEPLHFQCHACSDGLRMEKIDQGVNALSFSPAVPFTQSTSFMDQTNIGAGEGSKKSTDSVKAEQMLMLQKALKMDVLEAYSMSNTLANSVQTWETNPASTHGNGELSALFNPKLNSNLKNVGVLTMELIGNSSLLHGGQGSITFSSNPSGFPGSYSTTHKKLPGTYSIHGGGGGGGNQIENDPIFSPNIFSISPYTPYSKPNTSNATLIAGSSSMLDKKKYFPGSSGNAGAGGSSSSSIKGPIKSTQQQQPQSSSSSSSKEESKATTPIESDNLKLLLSPFSQLLFNPPPQVLIIDRLHSGARRFIVLDFGSPVLLTDILIPSSCDLVSLAIDIWLHREEIDGQRLVVASDIGLRNLVICDLQPPPVVRYLKITTIGRYGMGTTRCRIPVGSFFGHKMILPTDIRSPSSEFPSDINVLNPNQISSHLTVLSSLVEDIGCRYLISCSKLKRFLDPLLKPEISALDHISYYLPKGKERSKLGLNSDTAILNAYQECMALQQQLNVAKHVVQRLEKSLAPYPVSSFENNTKDLSEICTDKIHLISEFLIESLLRITYIATSTTTVSPPYSLYFMGLDNCVNLFKNVCVLENGQCQLSTSIFLLRIAGLQPWWGQFIASTLKDLFSSSNNTIFPQDRVFILLVYMGQRALVNGQNISVLEDVLKLLKDLLEPIDTQKTDFFLRSKTDMTLLGWINMYLCYLLDGVPWGSCSDENSKKKDKDTSSPKDSSSSSCLPSSSRWGFIQGESALYRRMNGPTKSSSVGNFKKRIQKKILQTKQKLEELDSVAGLGYAQQLNQTVGGLGNQLSALGNKLEAIKQKHASIGKNIKIQSSKHFKDLLQIRRSEMLFKKLGKEGSREGETSSSDIEINLNLNSELRLAVAKSLATCILRMDSTTAADLYLISLKALAKIVTCNPVLPLGSIFNEQQLVSLILTAVGRDNLDQNNWSAGWVTHAIFQLILDIFEQEKFNPKSKVVESLNNDDPMIATATSFQENKQQQNPVSQQPTPPTSNNTIANNAEGLVEPQINESQEENMMVDDQVDSENLENLISMELEPGIGDSEDSEFDDLILSDSYSFSSQNTQNGTQNIGNVSSGSNASKKSHHYKKLTPCTITSISTALDSRLEISVLSTTELRLRTMAVLDAETLVSSLANPIEVPAEIAKTIKSQKSTSTPPEPVDFSTTIDSCKLLSKCFDTIFALTSSSSVCVERVLQLWLSINGSDSNSSIEDVPSIPLTQNSVNHLMQAFSKDTAISIQQWGLGFQALILTANQKGDSNLANWLYILKDKNFPEMILRFISGNGMNYQKTHLLSVGPTIAQSFYNFLLRMRELSNGTPWVLALKEVMLRVLSSFLSGDRNGPFLSQEFALDGFSKFLDRIITPDLTYESAATVITIIEQFIQILHLFVFFPNKISLTEKSIGGISSLSTPSTSSSSNEGKFGKSQNFEHIIFRLTSLVANLVQLPYKQKNQTSTDPEVDKFLNEMSLLSKLRGFNDVLSDPLSKFSEHSQPKTIADIVLKMEKTMNRILSVLAHPNGINLINVLVTGNLLNAFQIMENSNPTTVSDAVIHLHSKLSSSASDSSSAVKPIFEFLSKTQYEDLYCPLHVSETFVLMVLKVISKQEHLKEFCALNCVEAVCQKLISSTRKFFSSRPTFVSILSTYIGRTENTMFGQKPKFGPEIELPDGLINAAPLGSIYSTNPNAHPSEVLLLQATPQHRRSRTPVWSFHFNEETYVELVVVLPCAILLKEVQIVIQLATSVSSTNSYIHTSSPSGVQIEVSRDRNGSTIPLGPPIQCNSSSINIQLSQTVAEKVLLRLFKPKESNNLGLSQIKLLGSTTFSEAALEGLSSSSLDSIKSLESSAHWIYILDKAVTNDKSAKVIHRVVKIPDMLETCYSMLLAPVASLKAQEVYLPHLQSVLFQFGCLRREISEQLMSALLGPIHKSIKGSPMVANANSQQVGVISQLHTVVELIFKLCCEIPQWGFDNLISLIKFLESAADENENSIVPEYVHCCAAILYHITSIGKLDLSFVITPTLLTKLYNWTLSLDDKSTLKKTLDNVILSFCYNKPWLFVYLMYLMNMIQAFDWIEPEQSMLEEIQNWFEEGCIWDRIECLPLNQIYSLNPKILMTLSRAAQSPTSCNILLQSQFLIHLNAAIMNFWTFWSNKWISSSDQYSNIQSEAQMAGPPPPSVQNIITILEFYAELCTVNTFKNWFGSSEGNVFIQSLLSLLSIIPGALKASYFGSSQTYLLEAALINFLTKFSSSHPDNQETVAKYLMDILVKQKISPHKAIFLHSMSSFCRRLLIQLLLENEKVIVHVKSSTKYPLRNPPSVLPLTSLHPKFGVNGGDRIFYMSSHSYIYELMKFIEPYGVTLEKIAANSDPNRFLSILKKEQGLIEAGLEMIDQMQLSMSGNAAKDKRNQLETKRPTKIATKKLKQENGLTFTEGNKKEEKTKGPSLILESEEFPDVQTPLSLTLATCFAAVKRDRTDTFLDALVFTIRTDDENEPVQDGSPILTPSSSNTDIMSLRESGKRDTIPEVFNVLPLPSTCEVFSRMGGLGLLAKKGLLPVVYPDLLRQIAIGSKFTGNIGLVTHNVDKESPMAVSDDAWVKIEPDDVYEEMIDSMNMSIATSTPLKKTAMSMQRPFPHSSPGIPPHSMAAFGLFLGLPRFSEVLLRERVGAQCMLRLVMGVTDDADGNDIFSSTIARNLPTLPFSILKTLLNLLPVNSEEGSQLRSAMIDIKAVHFILACLAVFTHQNFDNASAFDLGLQHELVIAATKAQGGTYADRGKFSSSSDDKSHMYWAKGTGFGTGSTTQNWNIEQSLTLKKMEEQNVTNLLDVLSSYIDPRVSSVVPDDVNDLTAETSSSAASFSTNYQLPNEITDLLKSSSLFPSIASYLRNDSVLDMARHVPLYTSILKLLRSLVSNQMTAQLLLPSEVKTKGSSSSSDDQSLTSLLSKMKQIVDNYSRRLTINSKGKNKGNKTTSIKTTMEDLEDEGLATLIADIQLTAKIVQKAVDEMTPADDIEMQDDSQEERLPVVKTIEERYLEEMKKLQFAFYDMITEDEETGGIRFTISYHYEGLARTSWSRNSPNRLKRLAQESVTLSTSLPIAYGSTIFVRCDTDRLDIMKVLITGPSGTPYANGCFEFDVFFPEEYPKTPMMINLETTGRQRVRFNPNLYTDGKVCLSILNTWHGRPEEKWNPQTSSLLPVVVAIQSLILNADPFFNEPGFEKSRGTEAGERNSREYNAGIEIATVEWAMLDQLRHPSPCFKDVIQRHFWMKRGEIIAQCENWLEKLVVTCRNDKRAGKHVTGNADPVTVFRNNLTLLKKELDKMTVPEGLEDLVDSTTTSQNSTSSSKTTPGIVPASSSTDSMDSSTTEPTNNKENSKQNLVADNPPETSLKLLSVDQVTNNEQDDDNYDDDTIMQE